MSVDAGALERRLAEAHRRYAERRPVSADLAERASRVLPGGSTRSVLDAQPFPFRVASAHGSRLVDVDGHEYVDLLGDFSAGLLGHDPCAVAYVIDPTLMRTVRAPIDIELTGGLTLGMTVVDLREPAGPEVTTQVAFDLDHARFWALVVDALERIGDPVVD